MSWSLEQLRSTKAGKAYLDSLGASLPQKREQGPKPTLDAKPPRFKKRKGGVALVVTLVTFRHRETDTDNNVASLKGIRDAVARSLGVDDADPRIKWCYGQARTDGETGTIVRIEVL